MKLCASSYTEFIHRQEGVIMAWYEEAVFYHMYPIGMTGAPRENREEGWCTGLKNWTNGFPMWQIWDVQLFI